MLGRTAVPRMKKPQNERFCAGGHCSGGSSFSRLDRKSARKQSQRSASMTIDRKDGPPSTREAPEDAPAFALS